MSNPMIAPIDWTDEEKAVVRKGYAEGRTISSMARELGRSRNAVTGVADRMGLKRHGQGGGAPMAETATVWLSERCVWPTDLTDAWPTYCGKKVKRAPYCTKHRKIAFTGRTMAEVWDGE